MNPDHSNKFKKGKKISIEQMWVLIEETLRNLDKVPDKTTMSDEQVLKLYDIITESNEMFRMLEQIAKLRKSIDDLTKNR